jgi:hypothetical protein
MCFRSGPASAPKGAAGKAIFFNHGRIVSLTSALYAALVILGDSRAPIRVYRRQRARPAGFKAPLAIDTGTRIFLRVISGAVLASRNSAKFVRRESRCRGGSLVIAAGGDQPRH